MQNNDLVMQQIQQEISSNGATTGTPISVIKNTNMQNNYNNSQNYQQYSNQNIQNYNQQYNNMNPHNYQQYNQYNRQPVQLQTSSTPNINQLVSEINKELDNYKPIRAKNSKISTVNKNKTESEDNDDTETETDTELEKVPFRQNKPLLHLIPDPVKELVLFVLIYVFMSFGFVKKTIGLYINQIVPDETGNISIYGVIIYGTILITLFLLIRNLLHGKL